jgi:Entner-Doudoroff aldolase
MPALSAQAFVDCLAAARAVAILRTPHGDRAGGALEAAIRGGFRIVEVTLNTPGALDLIRTLSQDPSLTVGAGTVLTPMEAAAAVEAGAAFLVSPVVDEAVIETARELGVPMVPGGSTPSELFKAHRLGAPVQKVFPAPEGGPGWVRQTLGPLPFLRLLPTSGVHQNNAAAYLKAGAFAVGFVASLFDGNDVANSEFGRIEQRARRMLEEVAAACR